MKSLQLGPCFKEEEEREGVADFGERGRRRRGARSQGGLVVQGAPVGVLEGVDQGLEEARRRWGSARRRGCSSAGYSGEGMARMRGWLASHRHVAEPPKLIRFKCANHHYYY